MINIKQEYIISSLIILVIILSCMFFIDKRDNESTIKYNILVAKCNEKIKDVNYYKNQSDTYTYLFHKYSESCTLGNLNYTREVFGYGGMYYSTGYYCVWTKEWNMTDIKYAENHEICHAMVDDDYDHFCS